MQPYPCILDTETTGIEEPEAVEIALLDLASSHQFLQRFKPSKRISFGAMATHHILNEELDGCPPSSSFQLPSVFTHMVGHNIGFDWEVIGKPNVKLIDTYALARDVWPECDSHRLGALLYFLDDPREVREWMKNAHNALADVMMTKTLLAFLCGTIGGLDINEPSSYARLHELSEIAKVPAYIDFGKHKGCLYADVPRDYKQWYFRQAETDPIVVQAMNYPRTHNILGRPFERKVYPKEW